MNNEQLLREKVEILDGSRKKNQRKAALRIEDIEGLLQIPARLKSKKTAGSSPTAEETDAIVEDIHALHRALRPIATALQRRLLP